MTLIRPSKLRYSAVWFFRVISDHSKNWSYCVVIGTCPNSGLPREIGTSRMYAVCASGDRGASKTIAIAHAS